MPVRISVEECEHGAQGRGRETRKVSKPLRGVGPAGAYEAVMAPFREPIVMCGRWGAMRPWDIG